ncbi:MAG: MATE family efflux transporter, partial [Myxococcota bacterium]
MRRRFLKLSALNVASNLTVPIASLVDTAMLGHLDEIRFLAGVALASVIFDYLFWAFGFLRMGTTGLVAVALGRGHPEEATRVFLRSAAIA